MSQDRIKQIADRAEGRKIDMRGNDLLPGALYRGPLDEFRAYDALPRAVRRALAAARFQCLRHIAWSSLHAERP